METLSLERLGGFDKYLFVPDELPPCHDEESETSYLSLLSERNDSNKLLSEYLRGRLDLEDQLGTRGFLSPDVPMSWWLWLLVGAIFLIAAASITLLLLSFLR